MLVAVVGVAVLVALAAPATAADPGKRFAHNRGTWASGLEPIEVHGSVKGPRSISIRVEWRGKAIPPGAMAAAAEAIPDGGIKVQWRVNCPTPNRGRRTNGTLNISSSPTLRALRLPSGRGPFCLVDAMATGPSDDSIGKILLDLYART